MDVPGRDLSPLENPMDLPPEFKQWLVKYLEANPPSLPVAQMLGYKPPASTFDKVVGELQVVNSAIATPVYSKTIPGKTLGKSGAVRVTIYGFLTNNTGATQTFVWAIKFGGTTFWSDGQSIPTLATQRVMPIQFTLHNAGAENANLLQGFTFQGDGSVPAAGYGHIATALAFGSGAESVDTTVDQVLEVDVQLGVASASLHYERFFAMAELL